VVGIRVRSRVVFPIRATAYWCFFRGRRPPTSGECDVPEVPVYIVYVSSPLVVVRPSSVEEGRVVLPGTDDTAASRFARATSVTDGGVGLDERRSSLACSLSDHSLAIPLIPEKKLGTRIFFDQPIQAKLSVEGDFGTGPISNSSSNIRRPRIPSFPARFDSNSSTRSIHSQTMIVLPIDAIERMYSPQPATN
jgi:hypothetical protein